MISLVAAAACLLLAPVGDGPQLTDVQKTELPRHFGFGALEIYKIDFGIDHLRLADLDADGSTDVLVWNGRHSRFELFYHPGKDAPPAAGDVSPERNEIPDRGSLRRETVPVDHSLSAVEIAELTGDRIPDIVFFSETKEIVVLPGQEDHRYGRPMRIRAPEGAARHGGLCVGDFNHDGRADVALRGSDMLLIFHQKPGGGLAEPRRLMHGIQSPTLMLTGDLNGDGRDDLLIGADEEPHGVYACLQEPDGSLAAMQPIRMPRARSTTIAKPADGDGGDDVYIIEYASGRLKHYRWGPPGSGSSNGWHQRLHSYPLKDDSKRRPVAVGDVDGDGLADGVALAPDAAQLVLFKGGPRGLGAGTPFPGLMKTTDVCVADIDGDGRAEVLLASPEEKMIGVSRFADGRLTYPKPLAAHGDPFVLTVGRLRPGKGVNRLAYVTRDEDEEFTLVIAKGGPGTEEARVSIDDLDDDPSGLRFADVNQDGRNDLLLFVRYASPKALLQTADGEFEALSGQQARDWLLKEVGTEGFALADVTGDDKPEVLLAQGNLARALVVRDGSWTVVDQYNPEDAGARLTGLAALPAKAGSPRFAMYDQKSTTLLVFERRPDKTYAVAERVPISHYDLTAMGPVSIGADQDVALLLADPKRLAVLTQDDDAHTLVEKQCYDTESKEAWLADTVVGDVNHDGVRDLALVDMAKAAIEIVTAAPGGDFLKAFRFQVFQGKRFADDPETRAEPRQVLMGDVTSDGIDDIVLLVHDRLIVYPGQ